MMMTFNWFDVKTWNGIGHGLQRSCVLYWYAQYMTTLFPTQPQKYDESNIFVQDLGHSDHQLAFLLTAQSTVENVNFFFIYLLFISFPFSYYNFYTVQFIGLIVSRCYIIQLLTNNLSLRGYYRTDQDTGAIIPSFYKYFLLFSLFNFFFLSFFYSTIEI